MRYHIVVTFEENGRERRYGAGYHSVKQASMALGDYEVMLRDTGYHDMYIVEDFKLNKQGCESCQSATNPADIQREVDAIAANMACSRPDLKQAILNLAMAVGEINNKFEKLESDLRDAK